ncbi:MAG: site-specific integrase, partial [Solirubrobacterales bacterium]
TFHEYASRWQARRELRRDVRESTLTRNRYDLTGHLLPYFKDYPLDRIRKADVQNYIDYKLAEREAGIDEPTLGERSINKTLVLLAQIIDDAIDDDVLNADASNPAKGRNRRLTPDAPARHYLDAAEQFTALLAAGAEIDGEARIRNGRGRAILATLMFAGLRIHELCNLRVRDLNLASGRLTVRKSKTAAGERVIPLLPVLLSELKAYKHGRPELAADDYLFRTAATGRTNQGKQAESPGRPSASNIRTRLLTPAVEKANVALAKLDAELIAPAITPHGLRRSFGSLLPAIDVPITDAQYQMGHADPAETLRDYSRVMRQTPEARAALKSLVNGEELAEIGRNVEKVDGVKITKSPKAASRADLRA